MVPPSCKLPVQNSNFPTRLMGEIGKVNRAMPMFNT